jgi:hypothetical protein
LVEPDGERMKSTGSELPARGGVEKKSMPERLAEKNRKLKERLENKDRELAELAGAVEKYSWETIPEEEKSEGKFYRKASPSSWTEDLTPRQARTVEEITRPILEAFYPDA